MKTLIIYDSFFGNTEQVARAIGSAVGAPQDVTVVKVADANLEQLQGVQVLLVGSPTRAFRPSPAITQFLAGIPAGALQSVNAAAFDTRSLIDDTVPGFLRLMIKWFGWAAPKIAKRLAAKGASLALTPEGFAVRGSEGPLVEGELERAAAWARGLLQSA